MIGLYIDVIYLNNIDGIYLKDGSRIVVFLFSIFIFVMEFLNGKENRYVLIFEGWDYLKIKIKEGLARRMRKK